MVNLLKIIIVGASGKMGQTLIKQIINDPNLKLIGAVDQSSCPSLGLDAGTSFGIKTDINITDDLESIIKEGDFIIDFTRPKASMSYLELSIKNNIKYVLGTTGFNEEEKKNILLASEQIPICFAPNMSVGVNLLFSLVEEATRILHKDYDIEIIESHHSEKVDAPSGTALRLGEAVAKAANLNFKENSVFDRKGEMKKRKKSDIGFSVIRGGEIAGEHTVSFIGENDRVDLTHKANNRSIFVNGAVNAAIFISKKKSGFYTMNDLLFS